MNKIELLKSAIMSNNSENDIPGIYTRVPYLESNGAQAIDLGFVPTYNKGRTEIECLSTNIVGTVGIWGYVVTSNVSNRIAMGINVSKWFAGSGKTIYNQNAIIDESVKLIYDRTNGTFSVNGNTVLVDNSTAIVSADNAFLFGRNDGNGKLYGTSFSGKITAYREYDEHGHLSIDLVPVYRNDDKKPGMYDRTRRRFITNIGGGEFIYMDEAEENFIPIEYIQSNGEQWIDTGLPNTGDYIFEDRAMVDLITTPKGDGSWLIGGRLNASYALGIFNGTSGFFNAYGTTTKSSLPGMAINTWYDIYFSREKVTLNGVSRVVNSGPLIPAEYETNVLLGKNQVSYNGLGDDARNLYGKREKTKITDAVSLEALRDYYAARGETSGRVGLVDRLTNKMYTSAGPEEFIAGPDIVDATVVVPTSFTLESNGDFVLEYEGEINPKWEFDPETGNVYLTSETLTDIPIYMDNDGNIILIEEKE